MTHHEPPAAAFDEATTGVFDQAGGRIDDPGTNQTAICQRTYDLADRAADLLAAFEALRDAVPPLYGAEAALADAPLVVLDNRQYARAAALGLAGRIGGLQFDAVIFGSDDRFRLARDCDDQQGAEVAFLIPAHDLLGDICDVLAWVPETGRIATLHGEVGTLGLPAAVAPMGAPPMVYETPLQWLLADEPGLFIIDERRAGYELDGVTIAATDRAAGLRVRDRLAPHMRRRPQILIPTKAAA